MAEVRPFRGFRYDLGKVGSLSNVVAPPYDVIDASLQQTLHDLSPANAIRVELTQDDPEGKVDKYTLAARTLNGWLHDDILRQDTARALYLYEQEFTVEGKTYTRRGFLGRVRVIPFGQGPIYPHEQTFAGPKADRLKLYHATGFNLSPVFGMYPDTDNEIMRLLESCVRGAPPFVAKDHLGVTNRLWIITDSTIISQVVGLMGPKPVFIADGHHRYETACQYLQDQRDTGEITDVEAPANFCLMMFVGMSDPGLVILPTHRLLSGLPNLTSAELRAILEPHFENFHDFGTDALAAWEHIQMDGNQTTLGFATTADGKYLVAELKDLSLMESLAPEQSEAWRGLGVSVLHRVVIDKLLAPLGTPACAYVHLLKEVTDALTAKTCQVACLVPPCQMDHVETIAGHGEKMPPKSTYFYPKLLTGMVFHSLKKQ
jgi:uncharacterized protein (DUF1015 family)